MLKNLVELFEERIKDEKSEDLLAAAMDVLGPLEVKHICYLSLDQSEAGETPKIETNYPRSWFDRYQERSYILIDPVVAAARKGVGSVNWRGVDRSCRQVASFFGEASEFGLRKNGLTIPIRDIENRRALFTINAAGSDQDWEAVLAEYSVDLRYIAFLFHLYHESSRKAPSDGYPHLSERERQVLSWAAAGKSAWETSMILGLSQRTIDSYMRNCVSKLGVANKTQAVAVAVSYELLEVNLFRQCQA